MKYPLLFSCLALSSFAFGADKQSDCGSTPSPYRASARHIEGKGIGYNQGYTSVDLFATRPGALTEKWIPFVDGRLHIFDNGRIGANIGLGLRYATSSVIYGINSYYDYRETSHQKYNQYALGFEGLGKVWDLRLNGYLPVGAKRSPFYNANFGYFSGNNIFLKGKRELAFRGLNLEAGVHIKDTSWMQIYGAFGPYYFGKGGKNAAGGKLRLNFTFLNSVKIEGSTSYDPVFHWIGQGEFSWMIPFGPKKKKTQRACSRSPRLYERAVQPVDRQEIIVLSHKTYYPLAYDPLTKNPYHVLFVDNTSHSLGTFESPYSTLKTAESNSAPSDLIYVFPGEGTDAGMNQGFVMQPSQKLFGSGVDNPIATQYGLITLPAQTQNTPLITNTSGAIITLSDNCEVAGLNLTTSNAVTYGILGGDPQNATFTVANPYLRSNTVNTPGATNAAIGICPSGLATLTDCTALGGSGSEAGIFIGSANGNLDVTANLAYCNGTGGVFGILVGPEDDFGDVTAILSHCTGTGPNSVGIQVGPANESGNVIALLSDCIGTAETSGYGIRIGPGNFGTATATLSNCTAESGGIRVGPDTSGAVTATLSNCIAENGGIWVGPNNGSGNVTASLSYCTGTGGGSFDGILVGPYGSGNVTATLSNCTGIAEGTGAGINVGSFTSSGDVTATLSNCTGTAGDDSFGILVGPFNGSGAVTATLYNCTGTAGNDSIGILVGLNEYGDVTATLSDCTGTAKIAGTGFWVGSGFNDVTATLSNVTGTGGTGGKGIQFQAPSGSLNVTLSGSPALVGTGGTAGITYNSPNTTIVTQ